MCLMKTCEASEGERAITKHYIVWCPVGNKQPCIVIVGDYNYHFNHWKFGLIAQNGFHADYLAAH